MQVASVSASLRQGMTMETSTEEELLREGSVFSEKLSINEWSNYKWAIKVRQDRKKFLCGDETNPWLFSCRSIKPGSDAVLEGGQKGLGIGAGIDVGPLDVGHLAEPGALGLGQSVGVDFDFFDGFVEGTLAFEVLDDFGVADGVAGLGAQGRLAMVEGLDLVDQSFFDHSADPLIDPGVEDFPRVAQAEEEHVVIRPEPTELSLKLADGLAGKVVDFQGADDSLQVVSVESCGGGRVNFFQFGVEFFGTDLIGSGLKLASEFGIGGRSFEESFRQGLEVQDRAADGEDQAAAGVDIVDGGLGPFHEPAGGKRFGRIDHIDQVVWDFLADCNVRLGRTDIHVAIDLHRIDGQDLGAELFGQGASEGALAGGGAADDEDNPGFGSGLHGLYFPLFALYNGFGYNKGLHG